MEQPTHPCPGYDRPCGVNVPDDHGMYCHFCNGTRQREIIEGTEREHRRLVECPCGGFITEARHTESLLHVTYAARLAAGRTHAARR